MAAQPPGAPNETRFERRLDTWVSRATTPRGAAVVIATASIVITLGAGIAMTIIDRDEYPSIGSGLWWAVQTTTTVGYGDVVPTTVGGRFLAVLVMLFGIGFLTVITAAITSTFVARSRFEQMTSDAGAPTAEALDQVNQRLERIEGALAASTRPAGTPSAAETPTEQLRRLDKRLERIEAALTDSS